ncbi:MAG: MarR family transcriptional regulator [Actinomycetota bacterium]|nr:MarR family transcriptional regulator [Actinomycetota bacterium]
MARTRAPELSEQQLDAWKAFLRAQAELIRTLDREMEAEQGLPITFFDVLAQLSNAGGQLRMSELADAVLLSRSGVTRVVDRMVRKGLVRREQCETDRRASYATLTAAGKRALTQAMPVHFRGIEEHFGRHLSCDEAKTLATALGRMVSSQDGDAC